jgi:hypothetical protein
MKTHILCSIDTDRGTRITGVLGAFKDIKEAEKRMKEMGKKEKRGGDFLDYYYQIQTMELE